MNPLRLVTLRTNAINRSNLSLRQMRADNLAMAMIRSCRSIPLTVLAALITCYAWGQTSKETHSDVTQSEYEIFSAFITRSFVGKAGEERVALPVSQIIIIDRTAYDESEITEEWPWQKVRRFLRKQVPLLSLATIENFREANKSDVALERKFSIPLPYQLVAESTVNSIIHRIEDWPKYYKQYPGAQGFLTFSRVGFSPDGEQAMFYVANNCGGKCASGSFVVARKHDAKWGIVKEVVFSVS